MKKRILVYSLAALLLLSAVLIKLPVPGQETTGPGTPSLDGPTLPTTWGTLPPLPVDPGQVTVYTCDSAAAEILTGLAQEYQEITGTAVTVVTAEGSCSDALTAQLEKGENGPTIFCLHSLADIQAKQEDLYDLTDSVVFSQLYSPGFAYQAGEKVLALSMDVTGYGLVYNAELLARAGFTRSDIKNFEALQTASQSITKKKPGFAAFTALDFADTSHRGLACLMAGSQGTSDQLKDFLDLYLAHDGAAKSALEQFLGRKSVFYMGGTWDYEKISALGGNNLDILPAFSPDGGGLQCITELSWGVNKNASDADIQWAMNFLAWLVTPTENAPAPVDRLGWLAPFKGAATWDNPLEKKLRIYMATEAVEVSWGCRKDLSEENLVLLSEALTAYAKKPTQENWSAVEALLRS